MAAAAAHADASAGIDSAAAHAWHMGQMVSSWTHNVVDLQQRMSVTEERLRLAEARIAGTAGTVSKMDPAALSGAGPHRQRLVDSKNLLPDSFSGGKGMQWRDWNHRTKCYMAAMKMIVRQAMDSVERRAEPVLYEQLQSFGMTPEDDTELKAFLALKTTDQAHTIVRQHDLDPGLEQYRALAAYFEPDTEARSLEDFRMILQPQTEGNMEDFAKRFPAWNAAYQLHVNRGGPTQALPDPVRRTIWIGMLPARERGTT